MRIGLEILKKNDCCVKTHLAEEEREKEQKEVSAGTRQQTASYLILLHPIREREREREKKKKKQQHDG